MRSATHHAAAPARRAILAAVVLVALGSFTHGAEPLRIVLDADTSKGVQVGEPVLSAGKEIGQVTGVGFGQDTVEVRLEIEPASRDEVRRDSIFTIVETAERTHAVEHVAGDPSSPPARSGERFEAARSLADVWLRRGRVTSRELAAAMAEGIEGLRRNIERLKQSEEWPKFREQIARLAAHMTVAQTELAKVIEDALPALGRELDTLYEEYRRELREQQPRSRD